MPKKEGCKTMTDKKKINILERLLDERDEQIRELQMKNAELEEMIESYKSVDDDIAELREIIQRGHEMNEEYNKMNREFRKMNKDFRRDIGKVMR